MLLRSGTPIASVLRASECVSVAEGGLDLGRWQRVFLVEFDGGERREVSVTLVGEAVS